MGNKRRRSSASLGAYLHHLDSPSSSTQPDAGQHNLSAYHPDLDLSSLNPEERAEYTSLVHLCLVHPARFPDGMKKYWRHRFSLLSLYAAGCLLDEQSWYSVTPESVAVRIAARCATERVVVDLFAGAGGNAIQFAMTCGRVIAVEIDALKVRLGRWNAKVYGVQDRITYVHGDSIELLDWLARGKVEGEKNEEWNGVSREELEDVEAVFLSPPWGGVDYAQTGQDGEPVHYPLDAVQPVDGQTLFTRVAAAFRTSNIAYYLPRNTALKQLAHLATLLPPPPASAPTQTPAETSTASSTSTTSETSESAEELETDQAVGEVQPVKVEYQYVHYGAKLSSLTAYYGALASEWDDDLDDWRH